MESMCLQRQPFLQGLLRTAFAREVHLQGQVAEEGGKKEDAEKRKALKVKLKSVAPKQAESLGEGGEYLLVRALLL